MERTFIKSSYSNMDPASGNCVETSAPEGLIFNKSGYYANVNGRVEVAAVPQQLFIRDSKVEAGPMLPMSPETFMHL